MAFVYPYLSRISGSRSPLSIAAALSKDNEVDIFTYSVRGDFIDTVRRIAGSSNFYYYNKIDGPRFGLIFSLRYQVMRGIDRFLYRKIMDKHLKNPYDIVIVGSNEGRNIGQYFKTEKMERRPVTAIILMELHDHGFHMHYERSLGVLRYLAWPIYPLVNVVERWRFNRYDLIYANSSWTATIFQYLYGIDVAGALPALAHEDITINSDEDQNYVAVPTVSLGKEHAEIIMRLFRDGIRMKCFGPRKLEMKEYVGFVDDSERLRIMANARVTLFLFDYEALGLIPLESLSLGTPVVTIPKEGPYEELRNCSDVYFARSYLEIKGKLLDILSYPKDQETISRCKTYSLRFSPESSAKKIVESYCGIERREN